MSEIDLHVSLNQAAPPQSRVSVNFPEGLRVLVVDDNVVCLKIVAALLNKCRYKVTATTKATEALKMLRKNKESYDIVITDVVKLDMNGFELLEIIGLEMDMPVIMMSANDDQESVMKGVTHGAQDYLIKPVRLEEVKNIWQHVVRKNLFNTTKSGTRQAGTHQNPPIPSSKRQREKSNEEEEEEKEEEQEEEEEQDDETNTHSNEESSAQKKKKKRVIWTGVLHNKFVAAVRLLGVDKAVPKKILQIMNEPAIPLSSVASHLYRYRIALRKENAKAKMSQESGDNINSNRTNGLLSDTITTSCINQGLNTINHHNRFAEQYISTGITSFGSRLQTFGASTLNAKLLQQNQLPPKVVADQMRPTLLGSVPPSPFFELNGMRFHSINSGAKMFDDNVKMSSSQLPSFNRGQSGPSSMPVGFGPYSSFSNAWSCFKSIESNFQPDSLAMLLPWQHEGRNLANLKVKEEPIDSIRKGQFPG
ncbi:hypothetical protein ACSBR2_015406 [Camellia fascicularis]